MVMVGVINTLELAGMSQVFVESYGLKTEGHVRLLALRPECPWAYEIPPAWAVPPRSQGQAPEADLYRAADELTRPLGDAAVLMARGSSLNERPGRSPTLFSLYDPRQREAGLRRFLSNLREVRDTDRDMGVLATVMVGGLSIFPDGSRGLGWDNVSFVADTRHPASPSDLHIAAVNGLGTRAVGGERETVLVTADRRTGLINGFINKTEPAFLQPFSGSRPCLYAGHYRQKAADYFDPGQGQVQSRRLLSSFFNDFRFDAEGMVCEDLPRVFCGRFVRRRRDVSVQDRKEYTALTGLPMQEIEVGVNPFRGGGRMLSPLIGALAYLDGRAGSVQVEGAFPSPAAAVPFLYQLIPSPEASWEDRPLRVRERHVFSDRVVGAGEFTGPLVWTYSENLAALAAIDRRFAETGYILLMPSHTGEVMAATPHCRLRLSAFLLNLGSHSMTLARLKMHEEPEAGYVVAMDVKVRDAARGSIAGRAADETHGDIRIMRRARLDSNGREMAVEIL